MRYYIVRIYREIHQIRRSGHDTVLIGVAEDGEGRLHPFHGIDELGHILKKIRIEKEARNAAEQAEPETPTKV